MIDSVMEIIFTSLIAILIMSLLIMIATEPCILYHKFIENKYCPSCGEYIDEIPSCECGKEYVAAEQEYCTACGKEQ